MGKRVKKIEELLEGVDEMKGINDGEADMIIREMKEMVKENRGEEMGLKEEEREIFEEVKKMEEEKKMEMKEMENKEMDFIEVLKGIKWDNEKVRELRKFVKTLKLERSEEGGRKEELISLLEKWERLSIKELSEKMGVSCKNISSLLLYLKKSGVKICTDSEGKKFIEK